MKNWTPKEVVAFIRDAGFEDMRGLSLECLTTLETNTVVESPVDSPVEETVTRKKRRRLNPATKGSMQPDGEIFNAIKKSFYSFPNQVLTVSDLAKHSGHSMQRVRAVEAYMITQGLLRRDGRSLNLIV